MINSRLGLQDPEKRLAPFEQAVNSAEARGRIVWLTLTSLSAYVLVVFLATSHEDMLLRSRPKLPILQIELSLEAFAFVGPGVLLLVHVMTLVNVLYIKDALGDYCGAISKTETESARLASWNRVASGIFIRGPGLPVPAVLRGAQWFLETITIWLAPPVIMLFCQLRFLPYHDLTITWIHRIILSLDVTFVAIAALAASYYLNKKQVRTDRLSIVRVLQFAPGASVLAVICFLSYLVFQHRQDQSWSPLTRCGETPCLVKLVFGEGISSATALSSGRPLLYRDIYAPASQLVTEAAEKLSDRPYSVSLRFRDLEGADLQGGRFYKVDFRGANLRRVNFRDADLREALFGCFRNPDVFICTNIQFADLSDASMQGADFQSAEAQGAGFSTWESHGAQLQRANFAHAKLAGARFHGDLVATEFLGANLRGARLSGNLTAASFVSADLSFADLSEAWLIGVNFHGAQLRGARLRNARMWRVNGAPKLKSGEAGEATVVDCRDVEIAKLTPAEYSFFKEELRKVPTTLDRPFPEYTYLDPANSLPEDAYGLALPDAPAWLDQCRNYDSSKQDDEFVRQYVFSICSPFSQDDDTTIFAIWPRSGYLGRLTSSPYKPDESHLWDRFHGRLFTDPQCTGLLARIRTGESEIYRDLFRSIWIEARRSGIDSAVVAAALGPCPDCETDPEDVSQRD